MRTDKLKEIITNYRNPNLILYANIYDCRNTVIDLRQALFKPVNLDNNNIKFLNIKFKRVL